uniref:Uncharacterized protein n=1 Tax=Avena sativa TaxID=4498 RepID=A0ACD5VK32_AVESA
MSRRCPSPASLLPASPLDIDDLLREILARLPPRPSSLPRASLVCTRWHHLVSEPGLLRRLRAHHRKPPLLGVFSFCDGKYRFTATRYPPDRIPETRFSLPHEPCRTLQGCRHGLAVLLDRRRGQAIVWDPLTGHQRRVAFPLGSDNRPVKNVGNAAVLCGSSGSDGHVGGDGHLPPFRLAVVWIDDDITRAFACLYESECGEWGNIVSTKTTALVCFIRSAVLVRNSLCWHLTSDNILEFDFERQSLVVIKQPSYARVINYASCHVVRTGNGVLGLAILSELSILIWEMNSNCHGVRRWMLRKTIQLEEQLSSLRPCTDRRRIIAASILGYDDDTNMIVLSTSVGHFMVQLESSQLRNVPRIGSTHPMACYPYSNFYIPEEKNQRIPTLRSQGFAAGGN